MKNDKYFQFKKTVAKIALQFVSKETQSFINIYDSNI